MLSSVVVQKAEEGSFRVEVPTLPGATPVENRQICH